MGPEEISRWAQRRNSHTHVGPKMSPEYIRRLGAGQEVSHVWPEMSPEQIWRAGVGQEVSHTGLR